MAPESPYRRGRLAPRCRLITSWLWRGFQGFVCSPIKVVRELGLERRETVRSLSAAGEGGGGGVRSYERSPCNPALVRRLWPSRKPRSHPGHREPLEAAKAESGPA